MGRKPILVDEFLGPLTIDRLTRDVEVFQRLKGHRFSSDDVVTAMIAVEAAPSAERVLDLGCGLGSVLLHLAWSLPHCTLAGIEAQEMSFQLLKRNVERSGFSHRIQIVHGDLRSASAVANLEGTYDLITGTPPYFPLTTALDAEDKQRAMARMEYRGGVEAYIEAGAPLLRESGTFVLCADSDAEPRVAGAANDAHLFIVERCQVYPKTHHPPLFSVWTLKKREPSAPTVSRLTLRDLSGMPTPDAARIKAFSGF